MQRNEKLKPFFIIGSGRCGTTLLRRILQANADIHIPPEFCMLPRVVRMFRRENYASWERLVCLSLEIIETAPDFPTFEISLTDLRESLLLVPEERRSLACILDRFYCYHADRAGSGCKTWGDKTPGNTFRMDRIHSVFPKLRAIHLLRDGVDVTASFLKAELYTAVAPAAVRWATAVKVARAFGMRHKEQFLEIRYEKLVQSPENTVNEICGFLDIEYDANMLSSIEHVPQMGDVGRLQHHSEVTTPIQTKSIGNGIRYFSSGDLKKIEHYIGDVLEWCDYPVFRHG